MALVEGLTIAHPLTPRFHRTEKNGLKDQETGAETDREGLSENTVWL